MIATLKYLGLALAFLAVSFIAYGLRGGFTVEVVKDDPEQKAKDLYLYAGVIGIVAASIMFICAVMKLLSTSRRGVYSAPIASA